MQRRTDFCVMVTICLMAHLAGSSYAATYHVDADNTNVGDGSTLNPFQTIEAGLQKATQGDTVRVHKVDGRVQPGQAPGAWGHYLLSQPLTVETGETLELEPGVVVKFRYITRKDTNPGIVINGCLRAVGQSGAARMAYTSRLNEIIQLVQVHTREPRRRRVIGITFTLPQAPMIPAA